MNKIKKINKMLINKIHIGHRKCFLNQSMKKYIININKEVHIINLEMTLNSIRCISKILKNIKKNNKKILFLCTKKQIKKYIEKICKKINMPYINKRWLGGSFTNFKTLKASINKMNYIEMMLKNKNFKIKKKSIHIYKKKIIRMKRFLKGLKNLKKIPDFIFIIDLKKNENAVKESKKIGVVSIGVGDTNNYVENIDYLIPGNDDSYKSVIFYIKEIVKVIKTNE